MISIGERPWAHATAATFERYSRICGADFHVASELPPRDELPLDLPDHPGRPFKLAYAAKSYVPWLFMTRHGYDRVLVVDDTCCVRPGTPVVFDEVPAGCCGYTGTSASHAEDSFKHIRALLERMGRPSIAYDPRLYANTGVLVYDATMKDALAPEEILAARDLLLAGYPHQTLCYYLFRKASVAMRTIPKAFNSIPAMRLPKPKRIALTDIRPHLDKNVHIYHVSGGYKHRATLVSQMAQAFLTEWGTAEAARRTN